MGFDFIHLLQMYRITENFLAFKEEETAQHCPEVTCQSPVAEQVQVQVFVLDLGDYN